MIKRTFLAILCGFFMLNAENNMNVKKQEESMTIEDMEGLVKLAELVVKTFVLHSIVPGLLGILIMRYSSMSFSGKLFATGALFLICGTITTYRALKEGLKNKSSLLINKPKKLLLDIFAITGGIQASLCLIASLVAKGISQYNQ